MELKSVGLRGRATDHYPMLKNAGVDTVYSSIIASVCQTADRRVEGQLDPLSREYARLRAMPAEATLPS